MLIIKPIDKNMMQKSKCPSAHPERECPSSWNIKEQLICSSKEHLKSFYHPADSGLIIKLDKSNQLHLPLRKNLMKLSIKWLRDPSEPYASAIKN